MSETIYVDVNGDEVVLADTVRDNVLLKHPEAIDFIDHIDRVLADPDEIRRSIRDEQSVLYYR